MTDYTTGHIVSGEAAKQHIHQEGLKQARQIADAIECVVINRSLLESIIAIMEADQRTIDALRQGKTINGAELAFVETGKTVAIQHARKTLDEEVE